LLGAIGAHALFRGRSSSLRRLLRSGGTGRCQVLFIESPNAVTPISGYGRPLSGGGVGRLSVSDFLEHFRVHRAVRFFLRSRKSRGQKDLSPSPGYLPDPASARLSSSLDRSFDPEALDGPKSGRNQKHHSRKKRKNSQKGRKPRGSLPGLFCVFLRFLRPCSPVFLAFLASLRET
jgi:hypothetical protein